MDAEDLELEKECESCSGTGVYHNDRCPDCKGDGVIITEIGAGILDFVLRRINIRRAVS